MTSPALFRSPTAARFFIGSLKRVILALTSVCLMLVMTGCSEDSHPLGPTEADSTWTVMVYDAADGTAVPIFGHFQAIATAHSGPYVNLLGLQDTETDSTKILYIDENNDVVKLEELGERNTGSEETLYDFVAYAKENYPADRYIMCFYGHGGSWFGCCGDATSRDGLRVHEIKNALARTGNVDLIFFTAPCLMGATEVAYELRNSAEILAASEGLSGFYLWDYPMKCIFAELHENPTISNVDLTEMAIEEMWNGWDPDPLWGPDTMMTMTAVITRRLNVLAGAIDDLAVAYLAEPDTFKARMASVGGEVRKFDDYVGDLVGLAERLLAVETDYGLRSKLDKVILRTKEAIMARCQAPNLDRTGGLSIFLPESGFQWMSYYRGEEDLTLEFVTDTHWDELMELLIEQTPDACRDADGMLILCHNGAVSRFMERSADNGN